MRGFTATTQHAMFRSTSSSQLKGRDSSEDTSMNEQTTRNKNTSCLCYRCARCCSLPKFRPVLCVRGGRVDVCTAFCLYYKMHLSLSPPFSLCACSQLFRWLNSCVCLHLYAICECLWFILLTVWTLPHDDCCFLITEQELGAQIDPTAFSGSLTQSSNPEVGSDSLTSAKMCQSVCACTYRGQEKNCPCAIRNIPVDTNIPRIVFQAQRETKKEGHRWEKENKTPTPTTRAAFSKNAQESLRTDIKKNLLRGWNYPQKTETEATTYGKYLN